LNKPITGRGSIIKNEVIIIGLISLTWVRREHLAHLWPSPTSESTRPDSEGTRAVIKPDESRCHTITDCQGKPGGRGIER